MENIAIVKGVKRISIARITSILISILYVLLEMLTENEKIRFIISRSGETEPYLSFVPLRSRRQTARGDLFFDRIGEKA